MPIRNRPFRCILLLLSHVLAAPLVGASPAFDAWADGFAREWSQADPIYASYTQYLPRAEQALLDRTLIGPHGIYSSASARAARLALAERGLEQLRKWQPSELTAPQRITARVLEWQLSNSAALARSGDGPYVFDQFFGLQVILTMVFTQLHPLRDAADLATYLARLEQFAPALDAGIAEAEDRAKRGFLPPRFIIDATVAGLDRFLAEPAAKNLLVATLQEKLSRDATAFPAAARTDAVASATRIIARDVLPAFSRVKAVVLKHRESANDQAGLSARPGGGAQYAALLASHTTTTLKPDEIHSIGLGEVQRIEAELDRELQGLGYKDGPLNARIAKLNADSQPPGDPDPRPALLAEIERHVRDAEVRARDLFDLRPKARIEIKREPAFTEKSAAATYMPPAPDGSRPGVYWVPLPGPTYNVLDFRTTAYHEAVPGHHFQIALQQESGDLPRYRKLGVFGGSTAFSEGWALYAERIADESGWYAGDPRGRIGYLAAQLLRARRLVVDTGLHVKGWSRQQAIDYGMPVSEVERYVVLPGQATAYMIGQLKIIELRDRARAALGAKYSVKAYHTLLLQTGSVPLAVLEQIVNDWIIAQR